MTPQGRTPRADRRRFLKSLGVAGVSSVFLTGHVLSAAGKPPAGTPPPHPPADKPTSGPPPASGSADQPPSEDARTLAEIVKRRYGAHLSPEQLEAVTRDLDDNLDSGRKLREKPLANSDEPDATFHA